MAVRTNYGRGPMLDRSPEYFPWMSQSVRRRTGGDLDQFLEPILSVQAKYPEFFYFEAFRDGSEVGGNRLGAVE